MQLFFAPAITDGFHMLDREESGHCIRVLRMVEGDALTLTDGRGGRYRAVIASANPKSCLLKVEEHTQMAARPCRLHMAVAPTKNIDRFEWFLEKATESGIDQITPIFCENSERQIIKPERLEKVLVSAMKQSLRCWLPQLQPAVKFSEFAAALHEGSKLIAHCAEGSKLPLSQALLPGSDALILIGPEGDFSAEEIAIATRAGFTAMSLGAYRLRTETAALAACMGFNLINKLL